MEKIKNNIHNIIISTIILMLPIIIGILIWDKLPDSAPVHFNAKGEVDRFGSKMSTVCEIPVFMMIFQLITVFAMTVSDKNKISDRIFGIVLYFFPMMSVIAVCICYAKALDYAINPISIILLFLGVIFLIIGNYLPKVKQNYVLGVRMRTTFESKRNWDATNRFAGWMMFIVGFVFIILGFLATIIDGLIVSIIVTALIPVMVIIMIVYSYNYKVKHKDEEGYFDN